MAYENAAEGAFRESAKASTAVDDIDTVDATDLATAITLANDTKAKVNELLAAQRTAGLLASS